MPPAVAAASAPALRFAERAALRLWSLCARLLLPLVLLRYCLLSWREAGYGQRLGERLGLFRPDDFRPDEEERTQGAIWVHAVSLGEVQVASLLVEALLEETSDKGPPAILFTCTTPTGSFAIRRQFAHRVMHCYMPWDTPGALERLLRRIKPRLLLLTEAELWPTLLDKCRQHRIPVVLANARISERSARRYRRFAVLSRPIFLTLRAALARTEQDAQHLVSLGVREKAVQTAGDLKYDTSDAERLQAQIESLGRELQIGYRDSVWIAGSTHEGEEEQVLAAAKAVLKQLPQALLILAPRHPRRFDQVAKQVEQAGLSCRRRSQGDSARQGQVLLLDSIGELAACYGLAQVAFVGGSLVPAGGHNLLEPAAQKRPVLAGDHLDNFAEIAERLRRTGGMQKVSNARSMARAVTELLRSPDKAQKMGEKALRGAWPEGQESGNQSLKQHLQAVRRVLDSRDFRAGRSA